MHTYIQVKDLNHRSVRCRGGREIECRQQHSAHAKGMLQRPGVRRYVLAGKFLCICIYIHIYMCVCTSKYICMYVYIYIYIYVLVYMYVCMYVCICTCIYTYIVRERDGRGGMYVWMYVCMRIRACKTEKHTHEYMHAYIHQYKHICADMTSLNSWGRLFSEQAHT